MPLFVDGEIIWGFPRKIVVRMQLNWKSRQELSSKKTALLWPVGILIVTLCLLAMSVCYLGFVKETIREDAKGTLAEVGKHIAESLDNAILNTNDVLGGLALEINQHSFADDVLQRFLSEQCDYWGFYDLAVIDKNGICLHPDGSRDIPANRQLLTDALLRGEITYDFYVSGGEDCVVYYYPLPLEERDKYLAICGTYAVRNWDLLMEIDVFDNAAVTHVLTKDGVLIAGKHNQQVRTYYNFWDYLEHARFENNITLSEVQQALKNGESLYLSYWLDDSEHYLICTPLRFNDWYLMFTIPAMVVNSAGNRMVQSVLVIGACLTLVFLLLLFSFHCSYARAQKKLWAAAYVDEVTGGDNKNKFERDAMALLERNGYSYMLVYTNIDQFKVLNQRLGKEGADRILCSLYDAFQEKLTPKECCARLTADHFVLLMEEDGIESRLSALAQGQMLQRTLSGAVCSIRLTFGLCAIEPGILELTAVIDRANLAMKMSPMRENGFAVYDATMMERAAREKELTEHMLQKNLQDECLIYLQPKVDIESGRVVGAEALARWNSPEFGFVSPGEFIPLAERTGSICQIDWVIFEMVCQTLARWRQEGIELLPISFNLSKAQLAIPNFLDRYWQIVQRYEIPCVYLDFEFTESLLYENSGALQQAVEEIHAMGARCSVDDFGFGYSSLGLLGQFEADTLKLDRSFFLDDASPDSRNNRIVRSVIQIADGLGMKTVAEGVEDGAHVDMLRQFGCGSIQGYYYSRPLPVDAFEQFLAEANKRRLLE